jgi:hypothetical protein
VLFEDNMENLPRVDVGLEICLALFVDQACLGRKLPPGSGLLPPAYPPWRGLATEID